MKECYPIERETFNKMNIDDKLGVLFDLGKSCYQETANLKRWNLKISGIAGFIGGLMAHLLQPFVSGK